MVDQLYEESAVLKQITEFYDQHMSERNHELCKVNIERESPLNADQETATALEVQTVLPLSKTPSRKDGEFYSISDFLKKKFLCFTFPHT